MAYADRTMTGPSPDNGQTGQGRYTVHEAALLLGLSVEAVRKRAERGKLTSVKGEDGARYILLDGDQTVTGPRPDHDQSELVEALTSQIEFLREELAARNVELRHREEQYREESRRKDHLLAAALERIPELPAPASPASGAAQEAADDPETASDLSPGVDPRGDDAGPEAGVSRRSWWRRVFGA